MALLHKYLKPAYFLLGFVFLILGVIGVFLPLIPGTPFVLLSAYFFSRSSSRVYRWCLNLPIIGQSIKDWETSKVIRPRAKVTAVLFIGIGTVFMWTRPQIPLPAKVATALTLTCVVVFILTRNSRRQSGSPSSTRKERN